MARSLDSLVAINTKIVGNPRYIGKTPSEIAILLNEPISQSPQVFDTVSVPKQDIGKILLTNKKWLNVEQAAGNGDLDAFLAIRLIQYGPDLVDTTLPTFASGMAAMLAQNIISQQEVDEVNALSQKERKRSDAEVLGLDTITQGDVEQALLV